jgi:hypothetical protein
MHFCTACRSTLAFIVTAIAKSQFIIKYDYYDLCTYRAQEHTFSLRCLPALYCVDGETFEHLVILYGYIALSVDLKKGTSVINPGL